jgi:hypothetical protein
MAVREADASTRSGLFLARHLDTLSDYYILGLVSRIQREGGDSTMPAKKKKTTAKKATKKKK